VKPLIATMNFRVIEPELFRYVSRAVSLLLRYHYHMHGVSYQNLVSLWYICKDDELWPR
jgi:hypothetical protein